MDENLTLTAQDVADILRIAKNTVYELVKRGELNHYKVGRKMRFTRPDVDSYIATSRSASRQAEVTSGSGSARSEVAHQESGFIICGKDSMLDVLTGYLGRRSDVDRPPLRAYVGSYAGLTSLYYGEVQAATTHLWDGDSNRYNVPFVRRLLPGVPAVVIHLTKRTQGLYVATGNPRNIQTWADLRHGTVTLINREKGAGSRVLLDEQLRLMKINGRSIPGYEREALSHISAAGVVGRGEADVGVGDMKAASMVEGVEFVPLQTEQFDMVVRKEDFETPVVQAILSVLRSRDFREQFQHMKGYDITDMGKVLAET
ncbi:MAG: helix-turn-helix transcriptional regulator [Deltaproteobacteria bacterium]|jgi:putative molybdopterin biosynthesis protein|nr:helix-turn-helix transcriptional regulator [Deltaproteobacteria bacterium]